MIGNSFSCANTESTKFAPEAMWSPTFEKPEWLPERAGRTRIAILERTVSDKVAYGFSA